MLHLIKLEFKKNKFKGNLLGVGIANIIISLFITLLYFDPVISEDVGILTYQEALFAIDTFIRATFIIYASVLLAKFVIEEYKSKTISLMFTYPVNRKKLIFAKLIIVALWTFLVIVASNIFVTGVFLTIDHSNHLIPETLDEGVIAKHAWNVLLNAVAAAGMSLIPLFFGMLKKSVPATVVSSIIIVAAICSNNNGFSLSMIIAVPLSLAAIGVLISYLSFRNIDKVDLT